MKRNWKLLQEILMFLTLSQNCKVRCIGEIYVGNCLGRFNGKHLIIKDEHYLEYDKYFDLGKWEKADQALQHSTAFVWDTDLVDYHVNLLVEIKAIKLIIEDIENTIDKTKWEQGYYDYADYDEFLYAPLEDYYPSIGVYKDVEFYQLTWLGIEMFDILKKMEKDEGVNLYELDTPHPTIIKCLNPLIKKASKLK